MRGSPADSGPSIAIAFQIHSNLSTSYLTTQRVRMGSRKYCQDLATICSPIGDTLQSIIPRRLASSFGLSIPPQNAPVFNYCAVVNATIRSIRKRQAVHKLDLDTSSLGNAGCTRLFKFLNSPAGLCCGESLTGLFLGGNGINNKGLLAVTTFLKGNLVLRELCLSRVRAQPSCIISGSFTCMHIRTH